LTTVPLSASARPAAAGPVPRSHVPGHYVAFWAVLASLALGYLAILAVRPDIAELLIIGSGNTAPEGNRGQRAAAKALAELEAMKRALSDVQEQLDGLKREQAERQAREWELIGRLAELERTSARVVEADAIARRRRGDKDPAKPTVLAGNHVQGTVEDRPMKVRVAPLSTAISQGAATTASGVKVSVGTGLQPAALGVEIASGPSIDALRLSWQMLQDANSAHLQALEPRFVEMRSDPASYALLAGPIATSEEAVKVCERLRAKKVACSITTFSGQPL
jgi:hypothetical protein